MTTKELQQLCLALDDGLHRAGQKLTQAGLTHEYAKVLSALDQRCPEWRDHLMRIRRELRGRKKR